MLTPTGIPAALAGTPSTALAIPPAPKKSNNSLILGLAGITVIAVVIGAWMMMQNREQVTASSATGTQAAPTSTPLPPASSDQTATAAASVPTPPSVPAGTGAAPPPPAGVTSSNPSATVPPPPGTTPVARNASTRPGATPTPAATPAAAATAPVTAPSATNDALATFPNVKIYLVNDKKVTDRDVIINFAGGQVMVMLKTGGEAIVAVPYKKILKATYSVSRDPKWDASLPGPPEGLDVGSVFRQTRHWLVVQGSERYAVLRLEDNNARQIIDTFETRTGLKVERVK
jgi:hypothetical protein